VIHAQDFVVRGKEEETIKYNTRKTRLISVSSEDEQRMDEYMKMMMGVAFVVCVSLMGSKKLHR
jgi:hypothetical protein